MPKGKHRISKSKAKKYFEDFDKRKKDHPKDFNGIPEGFLFEAEDVKTLLSHPDSFYFMLKFGWKKTKKHDGSEKEMIAPVLMVLNEKYEILNPDSAAENKLAAGATRAFGDEDEGGGYLDEGAPIPPPHSLGF